MHLLIRQVPSLALLLSALGLVGASSLRAEELEIFRPSHRPAAELAPVADALLAPKGVAIADEPSGTLVLRGSRESLDQALVALRSLDVAPIMYRIESQLSSEQDLWGRGLEVDVWQRSGSIRIGTIPAPPSEPGARVIFRQLESSRAEGLRTRLSVLEGHDAEIWTGTRFPVHVRVFEDRDRDLRFLETTPEGAVRTGFRVRPRSLSSGGIELEISQIAEDPQLRERGGPAAIRTLDVTTTVRLTAGESLVISGIEAQAETRLDTRFGSERIDRGSRKSLLWLRVSPEDSDPRP